MTSAQAFIVFILTGLYIGRITAFAKINGEYCVFDNKTYALGESWHPLVSQFDTACANCTCGKEGNVSCVRQDCPKLDCISKVIPAGKCCPTCTDNLPPSAGPPLVVPPLASCDYVGRVYPHGAKFASTSSGIVPTSDNQCTLCVCQDGRTLCYLKTCPQLHCERPIYFPDDCCLACPDGMEMEAFTDYSLLESPGQDCTNGEIVYKNGETWHPEVGTFGPVNCVLCQCNNSQILCKRIECEEKENRSCDQPVVEPGRCCRSCRPEEKDTERRVCYHVYRLHTRRKYVIAFENARTHKAELHTWILQGGTIRNYYTETRDDLPLHEFKKLGEAKTNRYERFKLRVQRHMEKCKPPCPRKYLLRQVRKFKKTLGHNRDVTSC